MSATFKKKILFVCIGNMIRSQMAEGLAREFGGAFLDVYSAGLRPTGEVSVDAIGVMEEKGINIDEQHSKGLRDVPLDDMDYVVSLMTRKAAKEICPPSFTGKMLDWPTADPLGHSFDFFRKARDEIEDHVKVLIKEIWSES